MQNIHYVRIKSCTNDQDNGIYVRFKNWFIAFWGEGFKILISEGFLFTVLDLNDKMRPLTVKN